MLYYIIVTAGVAVVAVLVAVLVAVFVAVVAAVLATVAVVAIAAAVATMYRMLRAMAQRFSVWLRRLRNVFSSPLPLVVVVRGGGG